ncbi:sensor histidine kinase [Streptomyces sp. MBT49]|uniref:ATP-binding protein n=1 Tax=Streptomyces sp. MBT49 TaxID=1488380 RepID=UPI00190B4A7D|nr:ATP-binding protein [Streptomyces sp. MBT49]MBK3626328.1 sensor histidine kinase [Streptomyces sp. MBT49]
MPSRRISHRRRRGHRTEEDRYLLNDVSSVLALPLLTVVALLGVTVLGCWVYRLGPAQLVVAVAGSVLVAALVGLLRARTVAAVLQRQREAEFQRITEAVSAAETTMIWTAEQLCQGKRPPLPEEPVPAGRGAVDRVVCLIGSLQVQGAGALLRVHDESPAAVLVEMHRTLARRQHGLIGELLEQVTGLQKGTEDPVLLDRFFSIDHLATRLRRMVESVSVVLGGRSLRETRAPVPVSVVLRGAKSEVVRYRRVQTVAGGVGTAYSLPAHVHPDVAHLLAELIDNGLEHSDPVTLVVVRAQKVAAGLLIEVEDRATLLMDPAKRDLLNRLIAQPEQADVAAHVRNGNLGLITTARIAARHGLKVWLIQNPMGGTTANVVIPERYLVPTAPLVGTVTVTAGRVAAAVAQPDAGVAQPAYAGAVQPTGRPAPGGVDPLPRRQRVERPMPAASGGPAVPSRAANPGAVAAWRSGLHAGLNASPTPGARPGSGPGPGAGPISSS